MKLLNPFRKIIFLYIYILGRAESVYHYVKALSQDNGGHFVDSLFIRLKHYTYNLSRFYKKSDEKLYGTVFKFISLNLEKIWTEVGT